MTRSDIIKPPASTKSNQFVRMKSPLNHIDYRGEPILEYDENLVEYDGRGFSSGSEDEEIKHVEKQSNSTTR